MGAAGRRRSRPLPRPGHPSPRRQARQPATRRRRQGSRGRLRAGPNRRRRPSHAHRTGDGHARLRRARADAGRGRIGPSRHLRTRRHPARPSHRPRAGAHRFVHAHGFVDTHRFVDAHGARRLASDPRRGSRAGPGQALPRHGQHGPGSAPVAASSSALGGHRPQSAAAPRAIRTLRGRRGGCGRGLARAQPRARGEQHRSARPRRDSVVSTLSGPRREPPPPRLARLRHGRARARLGHVARPGHRDSDLADHRLRAAVPRTIGARRQFPRRLPLRRRRARSAERTVGQVPSVERRASGGLDLGAARSTARCRRRRRARAGAGLPRPSARHGRHLLVESRRLGYPPAGLGPA